MLWAWRSVRVDVETSKLNVLQLLRLGYHDAVQTSKPDLIIDEVILGGSSPWKRATDEDTDRLAQFGSSPYMSPYIYIFFILFIYWGCSWFLLLSLEMCLKTADWLDKYGTGHLHGPPTLWMYDELEGWERPLKSLNSQSLFT
jgi:hypothetical protein